MGGLGILGAGIGVLAGVEDERPNVVLLPSSVEEAAEEEGDQADKVLAMGVLGVVAADEAENGPLEAAARMGRRFRKVEVEIPWLLERLGLDGSVLEGDGDVEVIDGVGGLLDVPSQYSKVVEVPLERGPH